MEQAQQPQEPQKLTIQPVQVEQMLKNPAVAKVYANGFITGKTQTDMFVIPMINGVPHMVLNLSFNSAKILRDALTKSINEIEERLGQEIKQLPKAEKK